MVEEWEKRCATVRAEYGEGLSEGVKVVVLLSMLPKELQDIVFQMGKGEEELSYREVREKVVAVAGNRVKLRTLKGEKGINEIDFDWGGYGGEEEEDWSGGSIDAMGKGMPGTQ